MKDSSLVPALAISVVLGVIVTAFVSMFGRGLFGGELPSGATAVVLMALATGVVFAILWPILRRSADRK